MILTEFLLRVIDLIHSDPINAIGCYIRFNVLTDGTIAIDKDLTVSRSEIVSIFLEGFKSLGKYPLVSIEPNRSFCLSNDSDYLFLKIQLYMPFQTPHWNSPND